MPITAGLQYGGSVRHAFTSGFTLGWSRKQRWALLVPNVAGHTVTLKAAASAEIPFGIGVWYIKNGAVSASFTLEDAEGDFSETIDAGKGCLVSKYRNAGGNPRFAIDKRDGL